MFEPENHFFDQMLKVFLTVMWCTLGATTVTKLAYSVPQALDRVTVDLHVPGCAGFGGRRACFEHARGPKPLVDTNAVHGP